MNVNVQTSFSGVAGKISPHNVKEVDVARYAILNPGDPENFLLTRYADVCTAIILFNADKAGCVHIYSDDYYKLGEDKLRRYARDSVQTLIKAMSTNQPMTAVVLGGRQNPQDISLSDEESNLHDFMIEGFVNVINSQRFKKLDQQLRSLSLSDPEWSKLWNKMSAMSEPYKKFKKANRKRKREISAFRSDITSFWIADEAVNTLSDSGITALEDFRFTGAPQTALYDRSAHTVSVDAHDAPWIQLLPDPPKERQGIHIFNSIFPLAI